MALWLEVATVAIISLTYLELFLYHEDQKLLSVNLGDLYITVRVSIEEELLGDTHRQYVEKGLASDCQVFADVLSDIALKFTRDKFVDLSNENSHLRYKLDKSLRHEDDSVVLS